MKISNVIEEFGESLILIAEELMKDEELCKLLYYSDKPVSQVNVPDKKKNILHKHIIVNTEVPFDTDEGSYILLTFNEIVPNSSNTSVADVAIYADILVPTGDWIYNNPSLRSFSIMKKVVEAFENINLKGVGKLQFNGASLAVAANSLSGYTVRFTNYQLGT